MMAFINSENEWRKTMISKEVFCTALRLWDKQFDKDCEVIAFFDEQYEAKSRLFLEAPEYLYNALYSLLAEAFGVASAVFNDSITSIVFNKWFFRSN